MSDTTAKTLLLIINPHSGVRKKSQTFARISHLFQSNGWAVTTVYTKSRGHATSLAADAVQYTRIVCMGGDGTLNEVVNGVLSSALPIELGYIPAGTTNDFAKGIALPRRLGRSAQFAATQPPIPTDMGQFSDGNGNSRFFSYVASFGLFTGVSYNTNQKFKNIFGHLAYVFEGIRSIAELHKFRPFSLRIEFGDTVLEQEYIFGAITNSTSIGGMVKLDKRNVQVADGKFELLLIRKPKNLAELTQTVTELVSHRYHPSRIVFAHIKHIRLISAMPLDWTLDGEYAGATPTVDIAVQPQALSLVRPEEVRRNPFFKKRTV